jgi:hypothetical protein
MFGWYGDVFGFQYFLEREHLQINTFYHSPSQVVFILNYG